VDVWRPGIDKYGAVTHLTVVLYDADEHTVCGPTPSSSLFAFFEKYGHDPKIFLECSRKCLSQTATRPEVVVVPSYGLAVVGTPLILEGAIVGAAVAGYVLLDFCQSSSIEGFARQAHVPFLELLHVARQLQPVPQRRLVLYGELLQVLGETILLENYRTRQYRDAVMQLEKEAVVLHDSEQALLEQAETLETIAHIGKIVAVELDMQKLAQAITDVGTKVIGARFGVFFFNLAPGEGKFDNPYAIFGMSGEEFVRLALPRHIELFEPMFSSQRVVRVDDLRIDPRYGENATFNARSSGDLPVTSYLTVPVVSRSGMILGGLFFGHPQPGFFNERHERIMTGLAAQAAVAIDNAQLYEVAIREQARAEAADRSKDEFLAMVSHELRTPLSAIVGWSQILADPRTKSEMTSKAKEIIERNARAQTQLVDDLLDMSRITTGKLRLEFQPIELTFIIKEALDVAQPAASAKAIDLRVRFEPEAAEISGDPDRLQQVVGNLVSNAIKFTPTGGWVEVRLERSDPHMQIIVTDNGKGIKSEFLPHLFDRFVQDDVSIARRYSGLGLGLTIVRHLVELHGGTVKAESKGEGQGATFTVRLPIRAVRSTARESEPALRRLRSREFDVSVQLDGVRALVVDDQADARDLLATVLEQYGVQVTLAGSTAEALAQIIDAGGKGKSPDILISDIGMSEEDGYELIHKVRDLGSDHGGNIPAVALTAYNRTDDRRRAIAAGFHAHVGKPVDPQELKMVIAGLTGRLDL